MADTRRLFFALWPTPGLRDHIYKRCRRVVRAAGGKPVPANNYHLTLAFLGNVAAELYPRILDAAAAVVPPAGEFSLDRIGYWPKSRILWLGTSEPVAELARVSIELWDRLEPLGLSRDARAFRAHLTLARKVNRAPMTAAPDRPLRWALRGFVLVESITDPKGARYTVAAAFPAGSCPEP
ncbi:MAG: RNA 2',3'-cyclic phosphodiesterase [Gammaproteobacteria bacterium]|nr:RNA 2',3'-cyclic phosphodiesterase [Gammaproteobacteria bacterium]